MFKTLLPLVGLAILLAGCGTPTKFGEAPLTKREERLLAEIDPSATTVTPFSEFVLDVSHPRVPSGNPYEILGLLFGSERRLEIALTVYERYSFIPIIYEASAEKACGSFERWPDGGVTVSPHTRRFRCLTPIEWVSWESQHSVKNCSSFLSNPDPRMRDAYYTLGQPHPCSPLMKRKPPQNFCDLYSKVIGQEPSSKMPCSRLADLVSKAKFQEQRQPTAPPTTPNISIDDSKAKCAELGFKAGTEKFGDCVLKLSK